ncbi:TEER-decreasing protein [Daedaleopsis nitida]|nr:TEER-decreasing protein [Daedaleopsis nitida]
MPTGPKTTWDDLSNLGWYKHDIFNALNKDREGTMREYSDMALNEGFANGWGWYCYNTLRGDPRAEQPVFKDLPDDDTVVWSYDNTKNSEAYEDTWTEKWTETRSASLTIKDSASISLKQSITIEGICSTEFGISLSTESDKTETQEKTHELEQTWKIKVEPGEKFKLVRTQSTRIGSQVYLQDYGLDPEHNLIATNGNKWNGHNYWGLYANTCLKNPTGTMKIVGSMKKVTYTFNMVRTGKDGTHKSYLVDMPESPFEDVDEVMTVVSDEKKAPIPGVAQ